MCLQYREGWISDAQTSFSREMNPHRKPNLKKTIRLGIGITENAPSLSEWFTKEFELKKIYIYIYMWLKVFKTDLSIIKANLVCDLISNLF